MKGKHVYYMLIIITVMNLSKKRREIEKRNWEVCKTIELKKDFKKDHFIKL